MQFAVIVNNVGKPFAIFVHDPSVGRVVFKGPTGSDLAASFAFSATKPVVRGTVVGGSIIRKKIPSNDPSYLREKLDDMIFPPYRVQQVSDISSSKALDDVADDLEKEWLV
jgi:hypothetical protein